MGGKVSREVVCEEARFILANVLAESRYGRKNRFNDIKGICEGAISLSFRQYVDFLEKFGYLRYERKTKLLRITTQGEGVVNGRALSRVAEHVESHFAEHFAAAEPSFDAGAPPSSGKGTSDTRYDKLATIGTGSVGTVYRARQIQLGREVALKEVCDLFSLFAPEQHAEIRRRFRDAVSASAQISHPNINPIHDVSFDSQYPFVISELAPAGSLRRLLNESEDLPITVALKFLLQSLQALRAAHAERVYHRCLKPEQMLIDGYGNVRLSDFSLSSVAQRDSTTVRQIFIAQGNIAYMAPEFYTDPQAAGASADIYALGIVFYEMLTRRLPGRRSPMPSHVNPDVPKGVDDVFDLMTRDARQERYSTVDDILEDLDRLEGLGEVLGTQSTPLPRGSDSSRNEIRESREHGRGEARESEREAAPIRVDSGMSRGKAHDEFESARASARESSELAAPIVESAPPAEPPHRRETKFDEDDHGDKDGPEENDFLDSEVTDAGQITQAHD